MDFTEGKLNKFERMMQVKPGFDHRPIKTSEERDCNHSSVSTGICPNFEMKEGTAIRDAIRRSYHDQEITVLLGKYGLYED